MGRGAGHQLKAEQALSDDQVLHQARGRSFTDADADGITHQLIEAQQGTVTAGDVDSCHRGAGDLHIFQYDFAVHEIHSDAQRTVDVVSEDPEAGHPGALNAEGGDRDQGVGAASRSLQAQHGARWPTDQRHPWPQLDPLVVLAGADFDDLAWQRLVEGSGDRSESLRIA